MADLGLITTGFQDLHKYEFVAKVDGPKDIYVTEIAKLDERIRELENKIDSFDIEAKRKELKEQAENFRNILKPRSRFALFFDTVIWTILYCIFASANTGLFVMFISFLFKANLELLPITIIVFIIYLIGLIAFIKYNQKIDKCLERGDDEALAWTFIMCVPVLSAATVVFGFCFFIGAKEFYKALDTAIYRCEEKAQHYSIQADYVHNMVHDLEKRLDSLQDKRWEYIMELNKICCCQNCRNSLLNTSELNMEMYICLKDKGSKGLRVPDCVCNIKK